MLPRHQNKRCQRERLLNNADIAELLTREADQVDGHLKRAYKRAARIAFIWPEELTDMVAQNRSLTEFPAIGPVLERKIRSWIEDPPEFSEPDELREDFFTLPAARKLLATNPGWAKKLRGDLQMHSTWSDGSGTISEMAAMAAERGYEYIAITDHTKGLKIAGGIDEKQLEEQGEEIREVNRELKKAGQELRVLRSTELNINPRGEGDMDPEALAKLDIVLGSFHSALRTKDDQTPRYLAAIRNPQLHILGHPRGRVFNYRLGLKADWERVFAEAAELDKAVEIDSYPDRQDLNVELLKLVKRAGCKVSIGTDAHHPWQLAFIELGLAAALAARIPEERILNFMPREKLLDWVAGVRAQAVKP